MNDTFIVELSFEVIWDTTVEVIAISSCVDELLRLVLANVLSNVVWTAELEFNEKLAVELGVKAISLLVLNVGGIEVTSVIRLVTLVVSYRDVAS